MRVNELRLGNLVDCLGQTREVLGISNRLRPDCGYYEFDGLPPLKGIHVKPIPLTEEWLVEFGFEKGDSLYNNYFIKGKDGYYSSIKYRQDNNADWGWAFSNDKSDANCYVITTIYNVHQLQNLYFALTGEELTIKL